MSEIGGSENGKRSEKSSLRWEKIFGGEIVQSKVFFSFLKKFSRNPTPRLSRIFIKCMVNIFKSLVCDFNRAPLQKVLEALLIQCAEHAGLGAIFNKIYHSQIFSPKNSKMNYYFIS